MRDMTVRDKIYRHTHLLRGSGGGLVHCGHVLVLPVSPRIPFFRIPRNSLPKVPTTHSATQTVTHSVTARPTHANLLDMIKES